MEKTSIEIGGLLIEEPMIALTDMVVAVVGIYFYIKLNENHKKSSFYHMDKYFLLMGLATFSSAIVGHAFNYYFGFNWKLLGWSFSAFSVLFFELSSIQHLKPIIGKKISQILYKIAIGQLILFFILIFNPDTRLFWIVQANGVFGLLGFLLPLHLYSGFKKQITSSKWIVSGITFGIVPAIVYNFKIGFHKWFSHDDFAHLLMAVFLLIIYQGVKEQINEGTMETKKTTSTIHQ